MQPGASTRHDASLTHILDASKLIGDQPRLTHESMAGVYANVRLGYQEALRKYRGLCHHSASHEHAISFLFHSGFADRRSHNVQGNAFPEAPS